MDKLKEKRMARTKLMNLREGAEHVGIPYHRFFDMVKRGEYFVRKLPNGRIRVTAEDLDRVPEPETYASAMSQKV